MQFNLLKFQIYQWLATREYVVTISGRGKQIRFIHRERWKAALPQMAGPLLSAIDHDRVAANCRGQLSSSG